LPSHNAAALWTYTSYYVLSSPLLGDWEIEADGTSHDGGLLVTHFFRSKKGLTRMGKLMTALRWIDGEAAALAERGAMALPFVRRRVQQEYDWVLAELEPSVRPYGGERPPITRLPREGHAQSGVLERFLTDLRASVAHAPAHSGSSRGDGALVRAGGLAPSAGRRR
jgi:hypothetical protein